jgi:DNA polymerase I
VLINLDAKQLEWVAACYLSGDKVGREELSAGVDTHQRNQEELELPSRLIAKIFLFRTIYCDESGGGAYGFSSDPDFNSVSKSAKFWQKRIDAFYSKYSGLAEWHAKLLSTVGATGRLVMPYGREYVFMRKENKKGDKIWPKTQIYNYPVQGLGAELMAIVRASLWRRLRASGTTFQLRSTVHDSVLIDVPDTEMSRIVELIFGVFQDVPKNFFKLFNVPFDVTLNVEVQVGPNQGSMKVVNQNGEFV